MRSPVDVVSKAFTEKAAPELGSKGDKTCQMERDEKDGSGKGNCMNHSTEHDGGWCLGKIQAKKSDRQKLSMGLPFLHDLQANEI